MVMVDVDPQRSRRLGGLGRGRAERRGAVLVFFALFFIAFFGLFAVVVDLGIVRTTQLQMQTSADAAALEGLAGRDAVLGDATAADIARRQSAAIAAALVFDEDLDLSTAPDQYLLGAGLVLDTGVGGASDPAGGVLTAGDPWVPRLELNAAGNLNSGDFVAGTFTSVDSSDPGRVDWHQEANDYTRRDFTPAVGGGSFLARLRRTRENAPLDRVPGVSSAGPTLPYIFGLGSAALAAPEPDLYDPRRDGITVRAVAVSDARPATAAGLARGDLVGLGPMALDAATADVRWLSLDALAWNALAVGAPFVLDLLPNGTIAGTAEGAALHGLPQVGASLVEGPVLLPDAPSPELDGLVFASVHARDGASGLLILQGFVALRVDSAAIVAGPVLRLQGVKLGATVAPRNATAQPTAALDTTLAILPPTTPLLAPVLAR